ncbi:phosphate ABC transporter ATP-binding protein [Liquorilactobacillus ghanensis]|uniref:phosphate ABC transporter ATP-binding protein n=1 Tax=Liquorilactobacillus ghanensis TaxID=399370 RepID=UPI0039EC16A7
MSQAILKTEHLNVAADRPILKNVTIAFRSAAITAVIGPSGSGKTTLLRAFNRLNEDHLSTSGRVLFQGINIYDPRVDCYRLRMEIGMLPSQPIIFPISLKANLMLAPRVNMKVSRQNLAMDIEQSLRQVCLWDKLQHQLTNKQFKLSTKDQQLFCLARALLLHPQILLLDEPTALLDPAATLQFEKILLKLRSHLTIIIVTHNLQQAARIADDTAFLQHGKLIEFAQTRELFTRPQQAATDQYLTKKLILK